MAQKASPKKTTKKTASKKAASRATAKKETPRAKSAAPAKKAAPKAAASPAKRAAPAPTPAPKSQPAPAEAATSAAGTKDIKKEKVQALTKADLQHFRDLLLERRREIIGDVGSMESEAFKGGSNLSNMPIHMADVGTDNFEQEFTLGLIESERQVLREIQEALIRIDNGTYGTCLGTGKLIPRVRLEAVPWAKYTIEYSRMLEQGKVSRDNGNVADDDGDDDED
jgi:RNA polymerase-binding transcription factor DksA